MNAPENSAPIDQSKQVTRLYYQLAIAYALATIGFCSLAIYAVDHKNPIVVWVAGIIGSTTSIMVLLNLAKIGHVEEQMAADSRVESI